MDAEIKMEYLKEFVNSTRFANNLDYKWNPHTIRDMVPLRASDNNVLMTHSLIFCTPRESVPITIDNPNHGWGPLRGQDKQIGKLQFRYHNSPELHVTFERWLRTEKLISSTTPERSVAAENKSG